MKCCIVYDVDGWCIHGHALGLQKFAPKGMNVEIRAAAEADHQWRSSCQTLYDLYLGGVNFQSQPERHVACVGSHCWMHTAFNPKNWRTRGVNRTRNHERGLVLLSHLDAVVCRNNALGEWAKPLCKSIGVFPGGIDPTIYFPKPRPLNAKLRVGFCGQVSGHPDSDFKGAAETWGPLVERLGDRYEFVANTRTHATRLNQQEMVEWFQSLDVFLCLSCADATPIPPYQAAACGAVVISTRVGQVADWKSLDYANLVVDDYGNEQEAAKVIDQITWKLALLEDPHVLAAKQEMLLASIEHSYSYRVLAPKTLSFVTGTEL